MTSNTLPKERQEITNEILSVAGGGPRRQILRLLDGKFDYCQNLATILKISPTSAWEHLHELETHNLVERASSAKPKAYQRRVFFTATELGSYMLTKLNTEGLL